MPEKLGLQEYTRLKLSDLSKKVVPPQKMSAPVPVELIDNNGTQKNPYDRSLASTQAIMNQMPKDGGVTGLESIGKIPLMYQMGKDTENARVYDQSMRAAQKEHAISVANYQAAKDERDYDLKKERHDADIAGMKDVRVKNAIGSAIELTKSGNEPEAVNLLRNVGIPITSFTVAGNMLQSRMENGAEVGLLQIAGKPTPSFVVWDPENATDPALGNWREASFAEIRKWSAGPPKRDTVQRGNLNVTQQWNAEKGEYEDIASGPKWAPSRAGGGGGGDDKEFRQWAGKLQSLQGRIASVQKGINPYSGEAIPQTNIEAALATLTPEVENTKRLLRSKFPDQYSTYFGNEVATAQPKPIQGDPNKHMPLSAAPAGPKNTIGGVQYYKAKDGNWYQDEADKRSPAQPMTATNPKTGQKIISIDGGKSWQPAR